MRECFFAFEKFFVKSYAGMQNMIRRKQKRRLAARNIPSWYELLLNLDGNLTAKCVSARQRRVDCLMARYPLVHPSKRSTILVCALSDL